MAETAVLSAKVRASIKTYDPQKERDDLMAMFDMEEIATIPLAPVRLICAKWVRRTAGSILTSQQTQNEDKFQSKVGLVLAVGPLAFVNDGSHDWGGIMPKVGDWVLYHYSDGQDFDYQVKNSFDRVPCKMISEGDVQAILPRPDFAY